MGKAFNWRPLARPQERQQPRKKTRLVMRDPGGALAKLGRQAACSGSHQILWTTKGTKPWRVVGVGQVAGCLRQV